jgi:cysteine synthase
MARIKKQLTELIGGTPLLELSRFSKKQGAKAQVIAKLEYFNPGGSVKDRIALAMIEDAESKGILKPGSVIIEPTSGNTGVGLAWVARVKGYKTILTMPETMSLERRNLLKAAGAQLALSYGVEPISFVSADPFSCFHFNDGSFFLAQKAAKEVIIIDFS